MKSNRMMWVLVVLVYSVSGQQMPKVSKKYLFFLTSQFPLCGFSKNDLYLIYSEFSVKIDTILKDRKDSSIKINDHIAIDRAGGRVKYPTGRIFTYSISGQEMPRLNGRYVFFLTYDEKRDMYLILTAYEILNGKITALDGKGGNPLAGFDFEKYNGMSEFEFLNQVRDSISE